MKKFLSLLIMFLLIFNSFSFVFAADAPPVPASDPQLDAFVEALWKFEGDSKEVLIEMMEVYFKLDEPNKQPFLDTYEGALNALSGLGDTLRAFGMTATVFGKLSDHGTDSKVYQAYIQDDIEVFRSAVYAASETIRSYADLDKLTYGLNRVYDTKVVSRYVGARDLGLMKVYVYNTATTKIVSTKTDNINALFLLAESFFTRKNVKQSDVINSLELLRGFYNTLGGADQVTVYDHFENQKLIAEKLTPPPTPPVVPGDTGGNATGNTAAPATVIIPEIPAVPQAGLLFDDLGGVEWAREAIEKLQAKGIIRGKAPNKFDPNGSITRAEFAAMATRLFAYEAKDTDKMTFGDIKATDWFFKEVKAAYIKGIILGNGESFNPYGNITRQEIATIIGRILSLNTFTVKDVTILDVFSDKAQIKAWAVVGSQLTVQEKIMSGRTADTFAPADSATRAEVAVILYRMKDNVKTILE